MKRLLPLLTVLVAAWPSAAAPRYVVATQLADTYAAKLVELPEEGEGAFSAELSDT
jgi:hypothetical protein